jgi:hypothetical protein
MNQTSKMLMEMDDSMLPGIGGSILMEIDGSLLTGTDDSIQTLHSVARLRVWLMQKVHLPVGLLIHYHTCRRPDYSQLYWISFYYYCNYCNYFYFQY